MLYVLYICTYIVYYCIIVHAVCSIKPHTYYIIIIYDVYTRRGISRVIGLRKYIQSSTVDLCGPLGPKMFFFYFYSFKRKHCSVTNGERNKVVSWAITRRRRRRSRRHRRRFFDVKVGIINFGIDLVCLHNILRDIYYTYTHHTRSDWYENKYVGHWASRVCISFFSSPRRCGLPPPLNNIHIYVYASLALRANGTIYVF